jgi:hypothetical protein
MGGAHQMASFPLFCTNNKMGNTVSKDYRVEMRLEIIFNIGKQIFALFAVYIEYIKYNIYFPYIQYKT